MLTDFGKLQNEKTGGTGRREEKRKEGKGEEEKKVEKKRIEEK